jgi:phage shock protein PspC (stress-responsive transcriptional regulator)
MENTQSTPRQGSHPKKLYRSRRDKKIAGVLGGLAEYFDIDATLLRVVYIVFFVLTFLWPAGIIYLALWAFIPEDPIYY